MHVPGWVLSSGVGAEKLGDQGLARSSQICCSWPRGRSGKYHMGLGSSLRAQDCLCRCTQVAGTQTPMAARIKTVPRLSSIKFERDALET